MKATEINLLTFLQKTQQFIIPIYQRPYSWTLKQCRQLWNDIERLATEDDNRSGGHFIGSMVYIQKGIYQSSVVPQLLVIDGQQRLTTVTLLLFALAKALEKSGQHSDITPKKIHNYYLFNSNEEDDLYYKLFLTRNDKETLHTLLSNVPLPTPQSPQIIENYKFFEKQLNQTEIPLNTLYEAFQKLVMVDIALDREKDNPQRIFESLNSTGLDLSQADLIRNYVLMGMEPKNQEALYNDYWYRMEQGFGHTEYKARFDRFMRDYLTIKLNRIPNIRSVYEEFKNLIQADKNYAAIKTLIAEIHNYATIYMRIALGGEEDPVIRQHLNDIVILKVEVAYPFLLQVYADYQKEIIDRNTLAEILKIVESYVFRRSVCGIPTASLNKTFASLNQEIDKNNYLQSVQAAFLLMETYRRFPRNEEFSSELLIKDAYNFSRRNYLLNKLENFGRKEKIYAEDYTIEHIMPQNPSLSENWQNDLGENWQEVQHKYLHTLGNLTLTGYNAELSDKPFQEKRTAEGGFQDSPLWLNHSLTKVESWNEENIKARCGKLIERAIQVWACPSLSSDLLDKYRRKNKSADARKNTLTKHIRVMDTYIYELFQQLRKQIINLNASVREEPKKVLYRLQNNDQLCRYHTPESST